jgi:hypothetical protein
LTLLPCNAEDPLETDVSAFVVDCFYLLVFWEAISGTAGRTKILKLYFLYYRITLFPSYNDFHSFLQHSRQVPGEGLGGLEPGGPDEFAQFVKVPDFKSLASCPVPGLDPPSERAVLAALLPGAALPRVPLLALPAGPEAAPPPGAGPGPAGRGAGAGPQPRHQRRARGLRPAGGAAQGESTRPSDSPVGSIVGSIWLLCLLCL